MTGHRGWAPMWRKAAPKARYSVVIIGGGGHGIATAYYLAKEHGIADVAVLEKGPIGLGNTGRNTTIIRSNYLWDESARIYEHSLKLWEGLSSELNFNVMLSQRGVLNLAHNEHDIREGKRRVNANRLNGIDAEWLESYVWDGCREFISNPGPALAGAQAELRKRMADSSTEEDRCRAFSRQIADKDTERENVMTLFRRGRVTLDETERQLEQVAAETAELRRLLDAGKALAKSSSL